MTALVSADSAANKPASDHGPGLETIVAGLNAPDFFQMKAAIEQARQHREAAVPLLVESFRKVAADAREGRKVEGVLPITGLCLLTEFGAAEALPVVIELLTLPGKSPEDLLDDAITEIAPRTLATLAADRLELLDEMIRDTRVNEYSRWAAIRVRSFLVRDGRLPRAEAVLALQHHLREAIDRSDRPIGAALVTELTALGGREAYKTIAEAFEARIVDESMIDLAEAEEEFAEANFRQQSLDHLPPTGIDNCVDELATWHWGPPDGSDELDELDADIWEGPGRLPTVMDMANSTLLPENLFIDDVQPGMPIRHEGHVGRNEPCPCGSGRKFKKCCGKPGT